MDANKKDTVIADVKGRFKKLEKEGKALAKSCTKPSPAEVKRTAWAVGAFGGAPTSTRDRAGAPRCDARATAGWGCVLVGVFGAVIELLMIPIVRLLTGEVEENRALARHVPPASSPLSRARAARRRALSRRASPQEPQSLVGRPSRAGAPA